MNNSKATIWVRVVDSFSTRVITLARQLGQVTRDDSGPTAGAEKESKQKKKFNKLIALVQQSVLSTWKKIINS